MLAAACSPARIAGALTPRGGTETREGLAYGPLPHQRLDLVLPPVVTARTPLVVFFYGGGWASGRRADYAFLARTLAAQGIAVAVPDYLLWPAGRWPDFVEDGARAVAWLRGEMPDRPLFTMGHSAGGFIAASLALDPRWLEAAGSSRTVLAGGVLLAAPIAWQPDEEPTISIFANAPGGRIAAVARPADLAGAPPMLLLHGADDRVVGPFHSVDLARDLRAAGRPVTLLVYPGVEHVGVLSAMAAPVRALGLAKAPVFEAVVGFLQPSG
ncbi:MAG: alpha/beta hydrolase [Roseomonas sp.]|nr:alpha/beta hydrolase [Roseomonas sp.]